MQTINDQLKMEDLNDSLAHHLVASKCVVHHADYQSASCPVILNVFLFITKNLHFTGEDVCEAHGYGRRGQWPRAETCKIINIPLTRGARLTF